MNNLVLVNMKDTLLWFFIAVAITVLFTKWLILGSITGPITCPTPAPASVVDVNRDGVVDVQDWSVFDARYPAEITTL